MMKIIAAAAFVAAPRQPAHAQAIVGRSRRSLNGPSTVMNYFICCV